MAGGTGAEPAAGLIACVEALAGAIEDPVAEVLALVWGPQFDREHALALLARLPRTEGGWIRTMQAFGDDFDALPPSGQRAVREGILQFADNAACRASC